jgi:hypothetical protein
MASKVRAKPVAQLAVELGNTLARVSSKKSAGDFSGANIVLRDAFKSLFGVEAAALSERSALELVAELQTREHVGAFVALLSEQADLERREGHKPEALALYRRALSVQQENLARNPKEAVRAAIRALELKVVELEGE